MYLYLPLITIQDNEVGKQQRRYWAMRTALFLTKGLSLDKGEKPSLCQNSVPLRYAAPDFDKCAARGVTFGHGQTRKVKNDTNT